MKKIAEADFATEVVANTKPVLVDIYAEWCQPCRMLAPTLEKVAKAYEGRVHIVKVDMEESQKITADYKVSSLPTLLFFKGGEVVKRLTGLQNEKSIKETLDTLI